MRQALEPLYDVPIGQTVILPNIAFLPLPPAQPGNIEGSVRIGLLGNLTRAKGLDTAVALHRILLGRGRAVELHLAGPPGDDDARDLLATLTHAPGVFIHGPVTGDAKAQFLASLDMLLFISTYPNEAQPCVISRGLSGWNATHRVRHRRNRRTVGPFRPVTCISGHPRCRTRRHGGTARGQS